MEDYKTMYENSQRQVVELTKKLEAKSYEKALEHAKECLKDGGISQNAINYIESIFPELKEENEDERIRKDIIELVKSQKEQQCHINGSVYNKMIDWLEKQGNLVKYYEDKLDKCACDNFNKGYKKALEQKPAEWSEDDENYFKGCIERIQIVDGDATLTDWLTCIKTRFFCNYHEGFKKGFAKAKEMHYDHWKPSEEQISTLYIASANCAYAKDQDRIRQLIEDLKNCKQT